MRAAARFVAASALVDTARAQETPAVASPPTVAPPANGVAAPANGAVPPPSAPPAATMPAPPQAVTSVSYPAQDPSAPAFTDVFIRGDTGTLVELYHPAATPGKDLPIARCATPCHAHVPVGRYKLYLPETETTVSGSRSLTLLSATGIDVKPRTKGQRMAGLAMGITGLAALLAGVTITNSAAQNGNDVDGVLGGVFIFTGGLVVTPIGWSLYELSFKPTVDVMPTAAFAFSPTVFPARSASGTTVGLAPGFALGGSF